jgi:hypothetical protein
MNLTMTRRIANVCLLGAVAGGAGLLSTLPIDRAEAAKPSSVLAVPSLRPAVISVFSPPPAQGVSNAGSDNTAFSQDNRDVRLVAFDSAATNLVGGDTNGRGDVFVLKKSPGAGSLGGKLERVSISSTGAQGNGDSSSPTVDGTTGEMPHCVAFESTATNLAPAATVHRSSIYLRDLRARRTSLVSAGSAAASEPSMDGFCSAVAYAAHDRVFVRDLRSGRALQIGAGEHPDIQTDGKGVAYDNGRQVYLQGLARRSGRLQKVGSRILVSSTAGGRPGNGASTNPAVDDHGRHVAFQTRATNLCILQCPLWDPHPADKNGPTSDILLRAVARSPGDDVDPRMQLVSGNSLSQGDGDSVNPAISRAGRQVVFETLSTNMDRVALAPPPNVLSWYWPSHDGYARIMVVSGAPAWVTPNSVFNGPSVHPSMSSRGNYVGFTSWETGLEGERNGASIPDVFLRFIGPNHEGLPTQ